MRLMRHHPILATLLAALLLAAILPPAATPGPAAAQVADAAGDSFGSAVPCLTAADKFAVTCFADTVFHAAPSGDPAAVEVGLSTKAALAAVGTTNGGGAGARVAGGVGSVYGLAYDDGAVSGAPRLFMAAFLKRLSSFGQGGPGGVYAYDLRRRAWAVEPLFVVPDAGWDRAPGVTDATDRGAVPHVGRSGLGDMEISPDGRELFIVNLGARRIERYDITAATPVRRAPIPIDDGVRDANDALDAVWAPLRGTMAAQEAAARADTVPFALEFSPLGAPDAPLLVLGLTDTGRRSVRNDGKEPPAGYPSIHLATYALRTGVWSPALSQSLNDPAVRDRMRDSQIAGLWGSTDRPSRQAPYSGRGLRGWNPWHDSLATMPHTLVAGLNETIFYPQPLLTDIEFSHDGRRMYLGLRDRTGDMVFAAEPPPGEFSSIAQGDTLVYDLRGAGWALQTTARSADPVNSNGGSQVVRPAPSDLFDDNRHAFALGIAPFHVENHGGALATAIQGDGRAIAERVATTALLGGRMSGISFYDAGGGLWSSAPNTLVTASRHAGGKSAALGDLEPLCTYAFVSGRLWHDVDGAGDQDPGEPGIAGVTLEAFRGSPSTAMPLARATTDAQGAYRFALPPNADIRIRISAADRATPGGAVSGYRFSPHNRAGGDDTRDSDAADAWGFLEFAGAPAAPVPGQTGAAIPAPVREQELSSVDIGLTKLPAAGVIGDRVWVDHNMNGLQDVYVDAQGATLTEPGLVAGLLAGMSFTLVPDPETATIAPALPAVRLPDGRYELRGVPPGRYAVQFGDLPPGYAATTPRVLAGSQDATDSDAEAPLLRTRYVVVSAPTAASPAPYANSDLDLGLVLDVIDLAVALDASPQVLPGGRIFYRLTAANIGSKLQPATNVNVIHRLPPGVAVDAGSVTAGAQIGGSAATGQFVSWSIPVLPRGASHEFSLVAYAPQTLPRAVPGQPLTASVTASTRAREATLANNYAEASTLLVRPELAVEKLGPAAVTVGDEFSYTLRLRNSGSASATGVDLEDRLPVGVTFLRWLGQPPAGCSYFSESRMVRCNDLGLPLGGELDVAFVARAELDAPNQVINSVSLATPIASDDPADNQASLQTSVLRPNTGVEVLIVPDEPEQRAGAPTFPVSTRGVIRVRYANGLVSPPAGVARGPARAAALSLDLSPGNYALGPLPPGCARDGARLICELGDLGPGAADALAIPISLPADFAPDTLQATAVITTTSYERPEDLGDNTATAAIDVVRPNVFVDAAGPAAIVGRGSVFWYSVDYGNLHRPAPALTRSAGGVVLRVTLPAEVTLVEADLPPSAIDGTTLTWELGALAPRAAGRIVLVVRTAVDAGASLRLDAAISTATPGDSPADNADSVTTDVVQPPAAIPEPSGDLVLAVSSELDPQRRDSAPDNGVYLTEGRRLAWPAGEIIDLTPRLTDLTIPGEADLPYPYAYRARVVGWSLRAVSVGGRAYDPASADSRGLPGCRAGAATAARPRLLEGCAYGYVDGASIEAIRRAAPLREDQLRGQARIYWTRPPAPRLPDEVYLYAADALAPVLVAVQVELELQIVNAAPGEIGGIPLPEVPVVPLPDPERRLFAETFEVTLLVPRTVVGPGTR